MKVNAASGRGEETIFALASAPGRAGIAVLRVSGPATRLAVKALTGKDVPEPRRAVLRSFRNDRGEIVDHGLLLWFEAPASFTGEDVAEFHLHGGRAVIEAVAETLLAHGRLAEPGEFSRRAVLNGKLDLTRAEAIADLVEAETDAQRRQALRQYEGGLAALIEGWRTELVGALAWAEAAIDFSDEELPDDVTARARNIALDVRLAMQSQLDDGHRGELIRDGLFLTVIGPPNAGKSSLVNALAGRDVAIVSEMSGTTRDVIEVRLNLGGYAVVLADTAGLRAAADSIEAEGVRRALARAEAADLVLMLADGSDPKAHTELPDSLSGKPWLMVWNKADLPWPVPRMGLRLSLKSGEGLDELIAAVTAKVRSLMEDRTMPSLTRPRHREALQQAVTALLRAEAAGEPELFAEDLRLALRALGRVTGRVDVEELLDVVFRDFCIGK